MTSVAKISSMAAPVALLMLAFAVISLISTRIFSGISLPAEGIYMDVAIMVALSALAFLKIWDEGRIKIVMYLSFVLYLPAVLSFSRMDLLMAFGSILNFSIFSSSLPPVAIILIGLWLACGGLLLQSFSRTRKARQSFLNRGADADEVDYALSRNLRIEVRLIAASAAVVLVIIAGVSIAVPVMLWVFQSVGFIYILAGVGAAVILGLILLAYGKPLKR